MFPFFNASNVDLKKFLISSKSNKPQLKNTTTTIETKQKNIHCPICNKKNVKRGIKCSNCHLLIHNNCSKQNQKEMLELKRVSKSTWECSTCLSMKFPFVYLSDEDIQSISLNFNFPCKCQKKHYHQT